MAARSPSLDGLRTVSCIAVIAFHCQVRGLRGGWLGVHVFFVMSGYLITNLLLNEYRTTGRISLSSFYLRRALRLYPALLLTICACKVLSISGSLAPTDVTGWGILAALTYFTNIWRLVGNDSGALSHTWSLSIEEQFYLLWPISLVVCRTGTKALRLALVLGAGSLLALTYLSPIALTVHSANGTHTLLWEILCGCCLSLWLQETRRTRTIFGHASTAAVLLSVLGFTMADLQRAWAPSIIPIVAGSCFAIMSVLDGGWLSKLLSLRPLPWIGRRTYAMYLYHFPITRLHGIANLAPWPRFLIVLSCTLILSTASYRFIERPCASWMGTFGRTGKITLAT
jgi:peptidoglycan/LPS O-acetylase OafA/YrhL